MDLWDPRFVPYRLRVVRIGLQVTALTLGAMLVFRMLPVGDPVPARVFWPLWSISALTALVVWRLPWAKLFVSPAGKKALYAWSAEYILVVTALIAFAPEGSTSFFGLYILTTIFFSLSFDARDQLVLVLFTTACYVGLYLLGEVSVGLAGLGLRLVVLAGAAILAGFSTSELLRGMGRASLGQEGAVRDKAFYESLVKTLSDIGHGLAIADTDAQRFTYINDAMCDIYGYSREELMSMSYVDLLAPPGQDLVAELRTVRERDGSQPEYHRDFTGRRKDGRLVVVEVVTKPLEGSHVFSLVRDVTEERLFEQELVSRQELSVAVSQLATDYAYSMRVEPDGSMSWEWVTEAYERVTGYTPEESEARGGWTALVHPDDVPALTRIWDSMLTTAEEGSDPATFEFRIITKSGEVRELRTFSRVAVEDGRVVRVFGAVQDITDTKRAEAALRASEERYRSLFERVPIGIFLRTPDGRGLDANPACVQIFGYPDRETFVGTHAEDLYVRSEDRDRWTALVEQDNTAPFEVEMRKFDGSTFWARLTARAVRGDTGDVIFYEGAVEDISERRTMETQLRQAQRMEAIGRLAGGIAHDFNNLLTAILGYCELLRDAPELSEATRQDILEIDGAAQMGADIASQLLDLSRRRVLRPEVLDLTEIVATMKPMLRRLIGDDIVLETKTSGDTTRIEADRSQIEQVVLNLAVNARDAMPEGGELCISTEVRDLDPAEAAKSLRLAPGPHVVLTVSDTGAGIEPAVRDRIFEPFFTTRSGSASTGLGLSTVYGIVSYYKGHISVDTAVGEGTTFRVYLPAATAALSPVARVRAAERWLSGREQILLVEDDDAVRRLARRALERYGYEVVEASDGAEALAADQEAALLLTDVVMPGKSGREVAQELLARQPGLRVLYMSGYTGEALERFGDLAWNEDFIAKPFRPDSLAGKVREMLNRDEPRTATR